MKTEKNNPEGTNRNEDTNQNKPSVTTGSSHLNQDTSKNPQKDDKETWKNPDPTSPEKRQDVYAGKKDRTDNMQDEEMDEEGISDEDADTDTTPQARITDKRDTKENDDMDRKSNSNDQINP